MNENEKVVNSLVSNVKCGCCGQHCEPADIDVMGQQEDMWILSVYCAACQSRGLVVASVEVSGMNDAEVVAEAEAVIRAESVIEAEAAIDLTEKEISEYSIPVNVDDVLNMHYFLKDFDGDFFSLFCEK